MIKNCGIFIRPALIAMLLAVGTLSCSSPVKVTPGPEARLVVSDAAAGDYMGWTAAASGDTVIVGGYRKSNGPGAANGAAYIFNYADGGWTQQARLLPEGTSGAYYFGAAAAIDGDTAVVGAWRENNSGGAAYVFVRNGGTWSQQARLTASDGVAGDQFGWSVAVSGDTVLVGAYARNGVAGVAYVFVRQSAAWSQQAEITGADTIAHDDFGWSVAVNGDTAVAGAWRKDNYIGAAYVFTRSGGAWSQQAKLEPGDGVANDLFGYAVAVDGNTIVAGAYGKNNNAGAAYIFSRKGTAWSQQARIAASDASGTDAFGWSVAVSGDTAVVGASGSNNSTGATYVFTRSGHAWTQADKIEASDGAAGDAFGWSVGVSGRLVVAGAYARDSKTGAVYAYH